MAVYQSINVLADEPPSQRCGDPTSQLPQGNAASRSGFAVALLLILISGAPLNHAGRRQALRSGHPGMDAGVAATRPWMADRGGPTEQCLTAGMPSLGEAPSGGARALCLLWRSSKVSRRKGGTLSGRDRSNGYVLTPHNQKKSKSCRNSCLSQPRQCSTAPTVDFCCLVRSSNQYSRWCGNTTRCCPPSWYW
jgi:hypothetical protein